MKKRLFISFICILMILIGLFYWPTLYRYAKLTEKGNTYPIRINRITGHTKIFFLDYGWVLPGNIFKNVTLIPVEQELSIYEIEKLKAKASIDASGLGQRSFFVELYNGSGWTIKGITVAIQIKEKNGTVRWDRKYKLRLSIAPFTSGKADTEVFDALDIGSFIWAIVEAKGIKTEE